MKTEDPWNEPANQPSPSVGSGFKRGTPTLCIRFSNAGKDFSHPLWVSTHMPHVPTHMGTPYTHMRMIERKKEERGEGQRNRGKEEMYN